MQEDFLHYIWKFKKFSFQKAFTTSGEPLHIISCGSHNFNSGPDFFSSTIIIGNQKWAGNVEIHINSSDWFVHNHHDDPAFNNLILHVVWNHDREIIQNGQIVPTLELKDLVSPGAFINYENLLVAPNYNFINCEHQFDQFSAFEVDNWLERMFLEKLEIKSEMILKIWKDSAGNWEEVAFKLLARNFGLKVNGDAFLRMAESLPFSVVQKCSHSRLKLEALFMGQMGMLEKKSPEDYLKELQQEYQFLQSKFKLSHKYVERPKFFRLRPDNFPTIRLAQLAAVYHNKSPLFSELIRINDLPQLRELFSAKISDFWNSHYTFEKEHSWKDKKLTAEFIDLILINTVIPLKFTYLKQQGLDDLSGVLNLMENIKPETNVITKRFKKIRKNVAVNALESQALLFMKPNYCDKNFCLKCSLGIKILGNSI